MQTLLTDIAAGEGVISMSRTTHDSTYTAMISLDQTRLKDIDLLVWNLEPLTGHFFSSALFDAR